MSKPPSKEIGETEGREVSTRLIEDIAYSYTNFANARISKYDFRLAFANKRSDENLEAVAGLVMSHLHAKELRDLLDRMIQVVEDVLGPIEDPSDKIQAYNEEKQETSG